MSLEDNFRVLSALADSGEPPLDESWFPKAVGLAQEAVDLLEQNSRLVRANYVRNKTQPAHSASSSKTKYSDAARVPIPLVSVANDSEASESRPFVSNVPSYLPLLARLVTMQPDLPKLREAFTRGALLHFFDPVLFPLLVDSFLVEDDTTERNCRVTNHYQVPSWWPQLQEGLSSQPSLVRSPLEFCNNISGNAPYQLQHLVKISVKILNLMNALTSKVSTHTLGALINIAHCLIESDAHRDVSILMLCHSSEAIDAIYSLSILNTSDTLKAQAVRIMEIVATRQSVVAVLCFSFVLPGAHRLVGLYSQKQQSAYELVSTKPFKFVLDLLDHANISNEPKKPILVTCIAVASQSIVGLSIASPTALYDSFNKFSKTRSLYVTLCSFGIETVKFTLSIKKDSESLEVVEMILDELDSPLPPFAKPNYFFVDRRPPNTKGLIKELESIYDIADLGTSLRMILTSINEVVEKEMIQILNLTSDRTLTTLILTNNFKYFLVLSLSTLFSNSNDEDGVNSDVCKGTIASIGRFIFATCKEYVSDLYVTLFNFGNDVSHLHTVAIPIVRELFTILINCSDNKEHQELVSSAIDLFHSTFGDFDNTSFPSEGLLSVSKNDYSFLYEKSKTSK